MHHRNRWEFIASLRDFMLCPAIPSSPLTLTQTRQFRVLRQKGTEMPGSSEFNKFYPKEGTFACVGCGTPLYASTGTPCGCRPQYPVAAWILEQLSNTSRMNDTHNTVAVLPR